MIKKNGYLAAVAILALELGPRAARGAELEPPVLVPRLPAPPGIDGRLEPSEWSGAASLGGFVQTYPGSGSPATAATTVHVGFDSAAIYFAVRAADDPARVRASLHARDELGDDDVVALYLDTFGDRNRAMSLRFNPLGVQQDGVFLEGVGTDLSVDLELRSAGRLTPHGFELEIAVPLDSLRFPGREEQLWGLQVLRQARQLGEESSWRPLPREHAVRFPLERTILLAGAGVLRIADPLRGERWLEATPTLSASLEGRRAPQSAGTGARGGDRWQSGSPETRGGVFARAAPTRNLVVEVAQRPDFGEVESDPPVLTVNNPFPLFFAERRPFFLEGLDLLKTLATTVDTRRIETPESALKAIWQGERDALAVLAARDGGPDAESGVAPESADTGVVRYRRSLGAEAWVGSLVTTRRARGRENLVAGVDGRLRLGPGTTLAAQLSASRTEGDFYDPGSDRLERREGRGLGWAFELDDRRERLSWRVSGLGFTEDYRADLGYVARLDSHRLRVETRYGPPARPGAKLVSWAFLHTAQLQADSRGRTQYGYLYPRVELSFRGETYLNLAAYVDYLKLVEDDYGPRRSVERPGAFLGAAERSTTYHGGSVTLGTRLGRSWSAELTLDRTLNTMDYDFGAGPRFPRVSPAALADPGAPLDPGSADTVTASIGATWRPSESWLASLTVTRDRMVRDDTGRVAYDSTLGSLRVERHFSRRMFARLRLDHDSLASETGARLLLAFQPRLGTALYVGYEDDRTHDGFDPRTGAPESGWRRSRQRAFLKLSWTFRQSWRSGSR